MTLSLSSGTDPRSIIAPTSFQISKQCCGPATRPVSLDRDGHRVELLLPPIVYMDRDDAPAISDVTQITRVTECWGLPPQNSWFFNRSPFPGWAIANTPDTNNLLSLEKYLHLIA